LIEIKRFTYYKDRKRLSSKLILVTGANTGIGKGITEGLTEKGHQVVMICRNTEQGSKVREELLTKYENASIEVLKGDLSSIRTVNELGNNILHKYNSIDAIIHNAGIWPGKLNLNEDGLESAFMVNHIAPLLLNHIIFPRMKESAPSRIVLVNAGLYPRGHFKADLTPYGKDFSRIKTYMNSKFCNILYMRKYASLIANSGVTINAVHPGVIKTGLGEFKGLIGFSLNFFRLFQRSIETGALGPINLVLNPDITTNGRYYDQLTLKPFPEKVLNEKLVTLLWDTSLNICNTQQFLV
jgi:NAD(P)-dependent dehydrogenase (short-subunit alcohol dehydrogenase family)